jgi:YVTN family beta-propeller protein
MLVVPLYDLTIVFAKEGVIDIILVGEAPFAITYNPDNEFVYVINLQSDSVSVIDQNNDVVESVAVGDGPLHITHNSGNGNMYVTSNPDSAVVIEDMVVVIDQNNDVVDTITVDDAPAAIAYNPANQKMYVANFFSIYVSAIGSIIPLANAGLEQTVDSAVRVQLDGRGSSDPRNQTLTYQWTQTAGPEVTLSDPNSVNPLL